MICVYCSKESGDFMVHEKCLKTQMVIAEGDALARTQLNTLIDSMLMFLKQDETKIEICYYGPGEDTGTKTAFRSSIPWNRTSLLDTLTRSLDYMNYFRHQATLNIKEDLS